MRLCELPVIWAAFSGKLLVLLAKTGPLRPYDNVAKALGTPKWLLNF